MELVVLILGISTLACLVSFFILVLVYVNISEKEIYKHEDRISTALEIIALCSAVLVSSFITTSIAALCMK